MTLGLVTVEQDLIVAAARLSRAAPTPWDEFLTAFRAYARELAEKLVATPSDTVFVAQGRAQSVAGVAKLFDKCRETTAAIEDNKKKG